jgi:hypothetical protein
LAASVGGAQLLHLRVNGRQAYFERRDGAQRSSVIDGNRSPWACVKLEIAKRQLRLDRAGLTGEHYPLVLSRMAPERR